MKSLYCKTCDTHTEHTEITPELYVCSICGLTSILKEQHEGSPAFNGLNYIAIDDPKSLRDLVREKVIEIAKEEIEKLF